VKLKWGAYELAVSTGGFSLQLARTPRRGPTGTRIGYTERWTVQGWLRGADPAALTTVINALLLAFSSDGQDLGLYTDADVATSHVLTNASTIGGTRVIEGPSFPEGQGAEYANQRAFLVVVEADFEDAGAATLLAFQESISITGTGGARFVYHSPIFGPPIKETVSAYSTVTIVQSGSAIGRAAYPTVPGPLLSSDEHVERRQISRKGPERLANGAYRNFECSWTYEFELSGGSSNATNPNYWGT
jgi:hypothetical protein